MQNLSFQKVKNVNKVTVRARTRLYVNKNTPAT